MAVTTLDGQLDDDVLLDETEVLAFLADCDMAKDVNAIPVVSAELAMTQWDVPVDSSDTCTSSVRTTPETAVVPTLTRQKKATWRQRQKNELLRLRALVTELTAQLDEVKLAAGVRSTLPATRRSVDMAGTVHSRVIKLQTVALTQTAAQWKAIANRQSLLREKSTQDNARLRDALGHYLLQVKSVQRALKKRLQDEAMDASLDVCKRYRLSNQVLSPPTNNRAVFDELVAGMDEMYADLDSTVEVEQMNALPCPGRKNNTANSKADGVFVEFLDSFAVPFELRCTANTIWCSSSNCDEPTNIVFAEHFAAGANTQMKSLGFIATTGSIDVNVVMRQVRRRYAERDRIVIIWRTQFETVDQCVPVVLKETSRMVLKHGASSELGPSTVMQSHRQATGHDRGNTAGQRWRAHPDVESGALAWINAITHFNHRVEDALLRGTT